jgi:hypothetical protein
MGANIGDQPAGDFLYLQRLGMRKARPFGQLPDRLGFIGK